MKFKEVTEDRYDEMLGCLPPAVWVGYGFLVGGPTNGAPSQAAKTLLPSLPSLSTEANSTKATRR